MTKKEKPPLAVPLVWIPIEPKIKADHPRMSEALARLLAEDSTFWVRIDDETSQALMGGTQETHLLTKLNILERKYNLRIKAGKPQVGYKETITLAVETIENFKDGKDEGRCLLMLEPLERGRDIEFQNNIPTEIIPTKIIEAAKNGLKRICSKGILMGYPVTDIKVILREGKLQGSETTFGRLADLAFKTAFRQAKPALLEPIMLVKVLTPKEYVDVIMDDLKIRRGCLVKRIEDRNDLKAILGLVPSDRMFGCHDVIRSISKGNATYTMELHHYQIVSRKRD